MKVIQTRKDFETEIKNSLKLKPKFIYISSFNIKVDDFLNEIYNTKCPDKRIVVGLDQPSKKQLSFLTNWFSAHGVKYNLRSKYHTKLFVTDTIAIIGGRNFTGSNWEDLSIVLKRQGSIEEIKKYFLNQFNKK